MKNRFDKNARGFTLIELLVVIAIIAVLIGVLLPALGKARKSARQAISLSNIRSLATAGATYQADQKGFLPLTPSYTRKRNDNFPTANLEGWCTWSAWGKNNQRTPWAGQTYDVEAVDRPLNPYIYSGEIEGPPSATTSLAAAASARTTFQLPVCKDPSDQIGHQQPQLTGGAFGTPNRDASSCYNDVGTSYQWQAKWFEQMTRRYPGSTLLQNFDRGARRLKLADAFLPSRLVWLNDEWADIVINNDDGFTVKNGYDETNKAVLGFMDGHGAYLPVIAGGANDPNAALRPDKVPAFNNERYTVVFTDGND